jgi:DNA-binding MarR family transcriptional regulator
MYFFGNLLLGDNNVLRNRDLLVEIETGNKSQSAKTEERETLKSKNCTLEEHFVLEFLKDNPKATQKEIAAYIKKSERTVKTITANLQTKGLLERKNGKRNGFWEIVVNEKGKD